MIKRYISGDGQRATIERRPDLDRVCGLTPRMKSDIYIIAEERETTSLADNFIVGFGETGLLHRTIRALEGDISSGKVTPRALGIIVDPLFVSGESERKVLKFLNETNLPILVYSPMPMDHLKRSHPDPGYLSGSNTTYFNSIQLMLTERIRDTLIGELLPSDQKLDCERRCPPSIGGVF